MASHPLADLLRVVDSDTRHDLEAALQIEVLRAGDVLFRQGDPAGDVFFLRSSRLGVRLRTGEGRETEIDVLEPGAEVGEVGLVTGQPRGATVYALEACELDRLEAAALEPAMSRFRILDFDAWRQILAAGGTSGREQVRAWLAAREAAGLPRPGTVAPSQQAAVGLP